MSINKKLRIACLSDRGLSPRGFKESLSYAFPHSEVIFILPADLHQHTLKTYDILILPGIHDEDSVYPTLLPPDKMSVLKETIEQDGLILWTFCASSYYMFDEISYQKRDGSFKNRQGVGLIKGVARHAFNHVTRRELKASVWNDYVLAALHVDGHRELLHALNINGPTFDVQEPKSPLVQEFMKYQDIEGAAGVIKKMGKGLLVALGVHPELSPVHLKLPPSYAKFEKDRWTILSLIQHRILAHLSDGQLLLPSPNTVDLQHG